MIKINLLNVSNHKKQGFSARLSQDVKAQVKEGQSFYKNLGNKSAEDFYNSQVDEVKKLAPSIIVETKNKGGSMINPYGEDYIILSKKGKTFDCESLNEADPFEKNLKKDSIKTLDGIVSLVENLKKFSK